MRTALLALLALAAVAFAEPSADRKLAAEDELDLGNVELLAQAHANQWRFRQVDKAALFALSLSRNNLDYKTQGTVADKDTSSRKEPSDLFKVEEATPSIAPVDKIVLPPKEAFKRRLRRLIAAGIVALIFLFILHLVLGWIRDARLASALEKPAK